MGLERSSSVQVPFKTANRLQYETSQSFTPSTNLHRDSVKDDSRPAEARALIGCAFPKMGKP